MGDKLTLVIAKGYFANVSRTARLIGLLVAVGMLLFSGYMFQSTGDWVALVFVLGSIGYLGVFLSNMKS